MYSISHSLAVYHSQSGDAVVFDFCITQRPHQNWVGRSLTIKWNATTCLHSHPLVINCIWRVNIILTLASGHHVCIYNNMMCEFENIGAQNDEAHVCIASHTNRTSKSNFKWMTCVYIALLRKFNQFLLSVFGQR